MNRLGSVDKVGREADQCAITIVELTQNQGSDERIKLASIAQPAHWARCCTFSTQLSWPSLSLVMSLTCTSMPMTVST